MKLIELNKEKLNNFLAEQDYSQFLQSYEWGEFQERTGQKVFRLGVEKNGVIIAVASFLKKNIGAGKAYFYCPRGPITQSSQPAARLAGIENYELRINVLNYIFDEMKNLAEIEKCLFLRFDPIEMLPRLAGDLHDERQAGGRGDGLVESKYQVKQTIDIQPSKTLILDLGKSEADLLKEMHQKTRYNIRLAEKKGVTIREANLDEFDKFWALMSATVERDGFRLHEKEYYRSMLQAQAPVRSAVGVRVEMAELVIKLYFAEYDGRIIAANIITFFGDMVTYVHGSSSDNDRNVMAPYLLQWEIIKQAKNLGYKHYDFYGIDENKWPGVTRFKRGFGGEEINYPGTFDVVFNSFLYKVYQTLRWLRRKF